MVMQLAFNIIFFLSRFDRFRLPQTNAALMLHATTEHRRPMTKDHFLENLSAVSFCEMRANAEREIRKRAWVWRVFLFFICFVFFFAFFCFSRVQFILWCCRTMHFQHPIKFHNHHLLVSRAARATVWCRQTCEVSQNTTYCILSLSCSISALSIFSSFYCCCWCFLWIHLFGHRAQPKSCFNL